MVNPNNRVRSLSVELGGYFEVLGTWNDSERVRNGIECWYPWDQDNPIIAWMEMPEIYKEE